MKNFLKKCLVCNKDVVYEMYETCLDHREQDPIFKIESPIMSQSPSPRKHSHYFKSVAELNEIDVYKVCELFGVNDPSGATQHAIKKLLLPGQRGAGKDMVKDLKEAADTITRRIEMIEETLKA